MRNNYTYAEVSWILNNYNTLRCGVMPDHIPAELGTRLPVSTQARFTFCCEMAAQVYIRVRKCGRDGLIVKVVYGMGEERPKPDRVLSREWHISLSEIWRTVNKVKWYCVGEDDNPLSYEDWKKMKPYRKKRTFVRGGQAA